LVKAEARTEMGSYLRCSSYTSAKPELSTIEAFEWAKYFEETRQHLPILHSVLDGTLTSTSAKAKGKIVM
jgi:hypothetical protein